MTYLYDHRIVPTDPDENAQWREQTLVHAERSRIFQKEVLDTCRKDFWYWAMGFAYVHEPRILEGSDTLKTDIPFLPWPHQIPVVNAILKALGKRDVRIVKSRAQGASWLVILIFTWCWLFMRGFIGNFVSKDQDAADKRNDMNSLLAKVDWLLTQLPEWMVGTRNQDWRRNHTSHTFAREDGETSINGFACTADVASGGRATAFVLDEHAKHPRPQDKQALAATQPITRCRIFISTPRGMDGAFYDIIHDKSIEDPLLVLDWKDNPTNNRGLYTIVHGRPIAVDPVKYGSLPPSYLDHDVWTKLKNRLLERGYDLSNGKPRSPWYDTEGLRSGADPTLIAQEYDMDFGSSVARYFSEALVSRLELQIVRMCLCGEFFVNHEKLVGRWSDNPDGRFRMWCPLGNDGRPPRGEYIVASDVASGIGGEGSSNSTITVFDRRAGKKVLAFASPSVLPYELAELDIAMCRWFINHDGTPAFLIWEVNNYGNEFKQRVERSDFNYYYRRKPKDATIYERDTGKAGYHTSKRSALLGPYREALLEGFFQNPDAESISELREYELAKDGEPVHVSEKSRDASGAKGAHGDRCIGDSLAWHASQTFGDQHSGRSESTGRNLNVNNVLSHMVPADSVAWRRARYLEAMRQKKVESKW